MSVRARRLVSVLEQRFHIYIHAFTSAGNFLGRFLSRLLRRPNVILFAAGVKRTFVASLVVTMRCLAEMLVANALLNQSTADIARPGPASSLWTSHFIAPVNFVESVSAACLGTSPDPRFTHGLFDLLPTIRFVLFLHLGTFERNMTGFAAELAGFEATAFHRAMKNHF